MDRWHDCMLLWTGRKSERKGEEVCVNKLIEDMDKGFAEYIKEWYVFGGLKKLKEYYGTPAWLP